MTQKLVVANWKMNGSSKANVDLIESIKALPSLAKQVICPPFVYLQQAGDLLESTEIGLGAQNVDWRESGAFTGEISAEMLADFDCGFVLIGHSERRSLFGEQNESCSKKVIAAQQSGVTPILCVGETKEQRGAGQTLEVVTQQVVEGLAGCNIDKLVLAYEPVWAIGTGDTASPEHASEVHQHIRSVLCGIDESKAATVRILYGGSVNAGNAASLFKMKDIDGALVGGASLKAQEFSDICCAE